MNFNGSRKTYLRGVFSRGTESGAEWPMQAWPVMHEMAARQLWQRDSPHIFIVVIVVVVIIIVSRRFLMAILVVILFVLIIYFVIVMVQVRGNRPAVYLRPALSGPQQFLAGVSTPECSGDLGKARGRAGRSVLQQLGMALGMTRSNRLLPRISRPSTINSKIPADIAAIRQLPHHSHGPISHVLGQHGFGLCSQVLPGQSLFPLLLHLVKRQALSDMGRPPLPRRARSTVLILILSLVASLPPGMVAAVGDQTQDLQATAPTPWSGPGLVAGIIGRGTGSTPVHSARPLSPQPGRCLRCCAVCARSPLVIQPKDLDQFAIDVL